MAKTMSPRAHGNDVATERKHYGVRRPFFPQSSSIQNRSANNNFFPGNLIQRMCTECQQEEEKVQRAPQSGSVPVYHGAEDGLAKTAGKGSALPKQTLGE